jgi:hypothetical protein
LSSLSNLFIVDSTPVETCKNSPYRTPNYLCHGNKGCTSAHYRQDLSTQSQIKLFCSRPEGAACSVEFCRGKRRKRIETPVSQLKE